MAISGFGNINNLKLNKPLNANLNKQQVETPKEEVVKEEVDKVELQTPKTSLEQVKYDQVDSLLVGKGIKINKPEQAENNDEITEITTNSKKLDRIIERFERKWGKLCDEYRNARENGDEERRKKIEKKLDKMITRGSKLDDKIYGK